MVALSELLAFDCYQHFVDEDNGPPFLTTYREFLGETYFEELGALQKLGAPDQVAFFLVLILNEARNNHEQ